MTQTKIISELAKKININTIYTGTVFSVINEKDLHNEVSLVTTDKPKPFVKWVGGKRQLLSQFRSMNLCPPEKFNPKTGRYFEPFVGGGAMFFDLMPKKAFLSDLNSELVITYNVIKNNVDELINSLKKHKYDKVYFLKIRAENPRQLSDVEIASRFIFLNRVCFNGMYRVNSKGQFNVPFGRYSNPIICDEKNLRKVSKELQGVEIKNQDYKQILKKARKGDFAYFDPPYYPISKTASFTSYTKESFSEKDQIELRDTFLELHKRGCFLMLSNSDTPFINKIYSDIIKHGVRITKVEAGRMINSKASGRGKITEVLVINY